MYKKTGRLISAGFAFYLALLQVVFHIGDAEKKPVLYSTGFAFV